MKKNRYKLKKFTMFLLAITLFMFGLNKAFAVEYTKLHPDAPSTGIMDYFTIEAYKCDKATIDPYENQIVSLLGRGASFNTSTDEGLLGMCAIAFTNELYDFSTFKVDSGDSVDPGSLFIVRIKYDYNGTTGNSIGTGSNISLMYNKDLLTAKELEDGYGLMGGYFYIGSRFDAKTWYPQDRWNKTVSLNDGYIMAILEDGTNGSMPLNNHQEIAYAGFKVNSTATPGASLSFYLGEQPGGTDLSYMSVSSGNQSAIDGNKMIYVAANTITPKVSGGSTSADNTLLSLTVTSSGVTYAFDSTTPFTTGNKTITTYLSYIPNAVASVDITAVANDPSGVVALASGSTLKADSDSSDRTFVSSDNGVSEGMNTFTIAVTAPSGAVEVYTLNVYRVSNDASLSSLTASGITLTKADDTTYTGTTTYDDSDTTVNATPSNQNATVSAGTGLWTFLYSGSTPNTRTVTVQAENCKHPEIQNGATCTSKDYTIRIMRTAPSSDATLSDLKVNGTSISTFSPSVKEYNYGDVSNSTTTLTIAATLNDSGASIVSGTGTCNLTIVGDNQCKVKTLAQDGETEDEYVINVHRLSNDITLNQLVFTSNPAGTLSPSFTSAYTTGEYTYTYQPSVSSIGVSATVTDVGKAQVAVVNATGGVPGTYSSALTTASNTFTMPAVTQAAVIVTAEDGTVHPFMIKFTRQQSTNNYLSDLTMKYNDGTTDVNVSLVPTGGSGTGFSSTQRAYTATVPASIDTVTLTATKAVQYSKVTKIGDTVATTATPDLTTGTKSNLQFGENTVQVIVLNEAGNDNTYTITLTREKYDIKTLSALNLGDGFTTTFTSGTNNTSTESYTYDGNIDFETTQLTLTGTKSNSYATVSAKLTDEKSVDHEIALTDGASDSFSGTVDIPTGANTITVTVTAHDGTKKNYTIAVTRDKNDDNSVSAIRISTGSGVDDYVEATKDTSDDTIWHATVPYSKTSVQPAEVAITVSSDANITKGSAVTGLSTTETKQFTFTVAAENGSTQPYTLNIRRAQNDEAVIRKVTLSISGATIGATASCTPDATTHTCTIGVPTSTTGYIDEVEASDGAVITPTPGSMHSMPSTESTATLNYTIVSENTQNTEHYVITIERTLSSVNTLSDLSVGGTTVSNFTPSRNSYTNTQLGTVSTVEVSATVTEIGKASVLRATVNDTAVTVTGSLTTGIYTFDAPLNFGDNAVVITVQAENEQTQNYNLTITRTKRNNPLLTYIVYKTDSTAESYTEIAGYAKETGSYTLPTVPYTTTSIEFKADPEDEFGSAIITSVTDENGTVTATNVADTDETDDNTYTASVDLSTGNNVIVITGTAHNGTTTKSYTLTINRTKNSQNTFSNLTVKGVAAEVDETDENGKTYKVTLPNSATSIDTTLASDISLTLPDGASVAYSPTTLSLSTTDPNVITITVTSESGVGEAYTLNITRTKSSDTTITGATITVASTESGENGSKLYCYFTGEKSCSLNVPTATTGFTLELAGGALTAGTTDPVIPTGGKVYEMPANQSTITIPITVTAENGTDTDEYSVTVNRAKSGNNNLADLAYRTDEGETTPWTTVTGFTPGTTLYRLEVEGDITELYLKATVQDTGKAKVNTDLSGAILLPFEQSQVDIEVEAENGNKTTYHLIVYRKHKTDALLKSIKVDNIYVAPFDPEVFAYTLDDVAYNKTSINIETEIHDEDDNTRAFVTGDGTVYLNTDTNTIDIVVTADDLTTKETYKLVIKRAKNNSTEITGIKLAGQTATYNSDDNVWEVSVGNEVDVADSTNVVVTPAPGARTTDELATTSLVSTPLLTTTTTDVTISITAEDGTQGTQTLRVTRAKSNVATLHTLTVEGGSFNPSFVQDSASSTKYTVTIPETADKVIINATPTDEHASVSGTGSFTFTGNSQYAINVTSEDQSNHETYVLEVIRSTSSVNTLKSITVSSGTVLGGNYTEYTLVATEDGTTEGFSPETTAYTVTIPGDISRINIAAETSDPRAQITNALTALGERELQVGSHTVTIRVQSESGAGQSYVLSITRLPKPFNTLIDLTVDGTTIADFSPDVTEYTLDDVENGTGSLIIGGTKEDADSSVRGFGTCDLKVGDNVCKVTVTAQNGTPKEYKINVKRKASDENRLSMLTVNGYTLSPAFSPDVNEYTVEVKATKTKLSPNDVTAIAKDSTATITKDPEVTLVTNEYTVYTVNVESASGKPNDYVIRVFKPKSSDATLSSLNLINASLSGSIQKNVTEYTLYVPHGVETFTIKGIPTVETTHVISGDDTYTLSETETVYLVTLAEDGTTSLTYTFRIEESLSNDATLSGLMVQGYPYVGTNTVFSPAITTYSIGDIDYSVTGLTILATATNTTSNIKYYVNGTLQTSNVVELSPGVGSGSVTVNVTAADGITHKDYTIMYNKTFSTNAYLAYMSSNVGSFTTNFIKTNTQYVLLVDETVEEVKLTLYTESENAYMSINGGTVVAGTEATPYVYTFTGVETGDNAISILVKPQDSEAEGKTYNVIVRKSEPAANSDATLESLSVTDYPFVSQSGYTTTEFAKDVIDYHIGTLNLKVNKVKVNYTTTQSGSTTSILVNGSKVTPDEDGFVALPEQETNNGVITVQVVAPNGSTTNNYNVHYIKVASNNAFLADIVVSNGTLDVDFYKETYNYTDTVSEDTMSETLTITPEVSTVTITVGSGAAAQTYDRFPVVHTINGLSAGTREVPITVTAENGNVAYYYVNIFKEGAGELITSNIYGHDIDTDKGYITSISPGKTGNDIKNELDNDNTKLKIFKVDLTTGEITDELADGELVGTGMIVKLYINGIENDSKVIVIKGDVSGDGKITITDVVKTLNHYLNKVMVSGAYLEAAEVSGDGNITITDVVKVLNHYLGKVYLTNHK